MKMNPKTIFILWALVAVPLVSPSAEVTGIVATAGGDALSGAIVRVTSPVPNSGSRRAREQPGLVIRNSRLEPNVLIVLTNEAFVLTNTDAALYNVHLRFRENTEQNIGMFGNRAVTLQMQKPELFARISEDLHRLNGHICILENPFYAVTDRDGKFTLPDLPLGSYQVEAVHPRKGRSQSEVRVKGGNATVDFMLSPATNRFLYVVRAGGSASYVGLTNAPESNLARVSFVDWERFEPPTAVLRLTNGEACSIMVWNVRAQARSAGRGTDGAGWDTVLDEFPFGDLKAWHKPNESGEFSVQLSGPAPWRVCILYSKEPARKPPGSHISAVGNYEVISEEIRARK
jgi:hypothetical protein